MKLAKRAELRLVGIEFFWDAEPLPGGHVEGAYMVYEDVDLLEIAKRPPPKLRYRGKWRYCHRRL